MRLSKKQSPEYKYYGLRGNDIWMSNNVDLLHEHGCTVYSSYHDALIAKVTSPSRGSRNVLWWLILVALVLILVIVIIITA